MEGPDSLSKDPSSGQHRTQPTLQPEPSPAPLQPRQQSSEQPHIPNTGHQLISLRKGFCAPHQKTLPFTFSARRSFTLADYLEAPGLQSVDTHQTSGQQWRGHFGSSTPEPGPGSQQILFQSCPQCLSSLCSRWCWWWQKPTFLQSGPVPRIPSKCTVGEWRDFAALPFATTFLPVTCQISAISTELYHLHTRAASTPAQPPSEPLTTM